LLCLGALLLFLDQLTKKLVSTSLPLIDSLFYRYPYGGIAVFQNLGGVEFSINHMTNTGAAWGLFGNHPLPLILLRIALILALGVSLCLSSHSSQQFALILIIAGAIGNVLDFFIYGHVVDMFHFVLWGYDFPIFNLADSAISIGIASLFFSRLLKRAKS